MLFIIASIGIKGTNRQHQDNVAWATQSTSTRAQYIQTAAAAAAGITTTTSLATAMLP